MRKQFPISIISILALTGCSLNTKTDDPNIVAKSDLSIAVPPTLEYFQYDTLDLSDLSVRETQYNKNNEIIKSEIITDYSMRIQNTNTEVSHGTRLTEVGDFFVEVYKENCDSTRFPITVQEVTSFTQSLTLTDSGTTGYVVGDTFDSDKIVVSLLTKYKTDKNKRLTEVIKGYDITINGKNADGFVFDKSGIYDVKINYTGWNNQPLSLEYTVSVIPENNITTPSKYTDNTISFTKDTTKMTVSISNPNKENASGDKGYYSPSEVINEYNLEDYSKNNASNWRFTPSTGEVPLLVVPVITPGDEKYATEDNWNKINKAFFGNSNELDFESLHSYYYQSSFGKLDLKGGVTGYFDPSTVKSKYSTLSAYSQSSVSEIAELAASWAATTYNINLSDYDSNNDGCIDGIWLVYLHNSAAEQNSTFWAFTSTTAKTGTTTTNTPIVNCYGWGGLDFINGALFGTSRVDAHVAIHETGHMLGLWDYYSYSYSGYSPLGRADMMDNNVGDHNAYSKLMLNYTTPYIAYSDCTITIDSSQSENAVIVIPYDDYQFKYDENGKVLFNAFDEYIILEYYTDKNLNAHDFTAYDVESIKGRGAKIYHSDARLFTIKGSSYTLPDDPYSVIDGSYSGKSYRCITNSEKGTQSESYFGFSDMNAFDELRLIREDGRYSSDNVAANNSALFKVNDSFSLKSYSSQFVNGAFDNKKAFNYTIRINSIA